MKLKRKVLCNLDDEKCVCAPHRTVCSLTKYSRQTARHHGSAGLCRHRSLLSGGCRHGIHSLASWEQWECHRGQGGGTALLLL